MTHGCKDIFPFATLTDGCKEANFNGFSHFFHENLLTSENMYLPMNLAEKSKFHFSFFKVDSQNPKFRVPSSLSPSPSPSLAPSPSPSPSSPPPNPHPLPFPPLHLHSPHTHHPKGLEAAIAHSRLYISQWTLYIVNCTAPIKHISLH